MTDDKPLTTRRQFVILPEITDRKHLRGNGGIYRVTLADIIIDNLNRRYWVWFPIDQFRNIGQGTAQALYVHLILGMEAARRKGKKIFTKRYRDVAEHWLRFQVEGSPSLARRQLQRPMSRLVESGVLKEWEIRRGVDGDMMVDFRFAGSTELKASEQISATSSVTIIEQEVHRETNSTLEKSIPSASTAPDLDTLKRNHPVEFAIASRQALGRSGSRIHEHSLRMKLEALLSETKNSDRS